MNIPQNVSDFIGSYQGHTPHLVVSLDVVEQKYRALDDAMPSAHHHYAIKANPHPDILKKLRELGSYFECASIQEIQMCLEVGVAASDILYGNPIKKISEIKQAFALGVEQYVFDAALELEKLVEHAPGAKVVCRITTDGSGAVSPLSVKFGCPKDKAIEWLKRAHFQGMVAYGVSFHTGSQQLKPESWHVPIRDAAAVFDAMKASGITTMKVLDVGGGFPVDYREHVPNITAFCDAITSYVERHFDSDLPIIYTEPGRYMSGDAGYILAEAVLISPCHTNPNHRWVYLDIGRYGGLVEEKIDYPILCDKGGEVGPVILAGQTCDSNDVIYTDDFRYQLPLSLTSGDRVVLAHTGVYTTTYSTALNGFPHLSSECI